MPWLVDADAAAAREGDPRKQAPGLGLHPAAGNMMFFHIGDPGLPH
jgi:hypothetical protein